MPIQITFTGEDFEHVAGEAKAIFLGEAAPGAAVTKEHVVPAAPENTTKPKGRRRGAKTIEETKPKSRRRGASAKSEKKKSELSPEMDDALKIAHQISEEIEEGEELVKEVLNEEYQKDNLSDLTDEQLAAVTKILIKELALAGDDD